MTAARKLKKAPVSKKPHLKLVTSDDKVSLKNTFWKSTLFNDIYLDQDIYRDNPAMWQLDGDPEFETCFNGLMNLFADWNEDQVTGWTETETINHWIKPILISLGWVDSEKTNSYPFAEETSFTLKEDGKARTYRADILISDTVDEMSLYADRKLKADVRLEKAKGKVLIPLEAKYWNRINKQYAGKLDKKEEKAKSKEADAANRLGPNGQTLKYMEILGLEWGMLSDGATWRLFNKELSSESEGRYLEFNIYNLYKRAQLALDNEQDSYIFREATKFFYNFFSKKALFPKAKKQELVRRALNESKSYAEDVEEDLKERFVKAMNVVCNGLQRAAGKKADLDMIRTVAESHLFNILFIKSCEARNILPLDANNYWEVSLSRMIDALHAFDPDDYEKSPKSMAKIIDEAYFWFKYKDSGYELFDSLINLSKMIHKGTNGNGKGFHIDGFMESVFDKAEWKFAKENKLTNIEMVQALFELGFAKAPKGSKRKFQEIPYQYFTPRQLGSIYESFLEYRLDKAAEDMAYVKKQWKPANLSSDKVKKMKVPKVSKGQLFFTPDNKDRKATGSYYTPHYIVEYIVKETIGPLCDGKTSSEILNLKVCDPAMGSGHFLNGALNYLNSKYLEALEDEILDDIDLSPAESKRIVLDSCVFGVDINPRAVKLAQMSLWLESAHVGKKLERLDDQLINTNAITDKNIWPSYKNLMCSGFSAVIGNPPYIGEKGNKDLFKPVKTSYLGKFYLGKMDYFYFFFHQALNMLCPGGRSGFISTNYFTTAMGAKNLRKDLFLRCDKISFVQLNDNKVFSSAAGQHNIITFFNRGDGNPEITTKNIPKSKNFGSKYFFNSLKSQEHVGKFEGDEAYIRLGMSGSDQLIDKILVSMEKHKRLGKEFRVNNGVHTQADYLSKSKYPYRNSKSSQVGDGIYVLNLKGNDAVTIKTIKKRKEEAKFLKPFFKNSDIQQFSTNTNNAKELIYINKKTCDLSKAPNIKRHLNKFKAIIEKASDNAPYLHRPKTESDFTSPKIVAPQRSSRNTFGYNEEAWFAASDVFFITEDRNTSLKLKYVLGLLNSKCYYVWFYFRGKRKGRNLELTNKPISEAPLIVPNSLEEKNIISSVNKLILNNADKEAWEDLNNTIYSLFELSKSEILAIEDFYDKYCGFSSMDRKHKVAA